MPTPPDLPRPREQFLTEITVARSSAASAPELLAQASGLSKSRIKDAMQKGAVWQSRGTRKPQRLRRATAPLQPGDHLALYYDSSVLDRIPPTATLVADHARYSVWHKPPGLLVEGSRYGDHATLLHQVAAHFKPARRVWLVHRLDLEAAGLLLIAHSPQAAARLSALFQARMIDKQYYIEAQGRLGEKDACGRIEIPLDAKAAVTDYRVIQYAAAQDLSHVEISMLSGRYHQIRRHLAAVGHPVLGDPKYGQGNAHPDGLRLVAVRLGFVDPWQEKAIQFSIAEETRARWGWDKHAPVGGDYRG